MDETVRALVFFCFISDEDLKMGIQEQRARQWEDIEWLTRYGTMGVEETKEKGMKWH